MMLIQLCYLVVIVDVELNIMLVVLCVYVIQFGLFKQFKQLEDEFGFLLFVCKGCSLELVILVGIEVIVCVCVVLVEVNNICMYVVNQWCESQGQLILIIMYIQVCFVLLLVVVVIKQVYLQVSVYLQQVGEIDVLDCLNQGDVDIVIISIVGGEFIDGIVVLLFCW